jgi:hypothetical protein
MSKRQKLRDIEEQKCLLVAKADLQRSTFLMLVSPVFKVVQAAEIGFFAVRFGRAIVRRIKQ